MKRGPLFLGLLTLLLLGLAVLYGWQSGSSAGPPGPYTHRASLIVQAALEAASANSPQTTAALLKVVATPLPSEPAEAAVWDLCGIGRMPRPAGSTVAGQSLLSDLPVHLGAEPAAAALVKLFATLDAGSARWRAAAVMLRGTDAAGQAAGPALRELAATSADPVIASWVVMRCSGAAKCSAADAQRWADLEPQNLAAWLSVVELQPERKSEVLQRAPATRRFDLHQGELLEAVLQALPTDELPYVQMHVWVYAIGVEAALGAPAMSALYGHCRPAPEPGSQRQQDCAAIAAVLLGANGSLYGWVAGTRLAELSGTPKRQADAWRAEANAWLQEAGRLSTADVQPLSCASVARSKAWLQLRVSLGELGAWRAIYAEAQLARAPTER